MAYTFHKFLPQPFVSKNPGIYAIVNRDNGKLYIGSAAVLAHRWSCHRHDFFRNRQNPYFARAFRKSPESFYFELIEELPGASKETRLSREQFWMDFYKSYTPASGYNTCPIARSCEGVKHGPEFSAMLSARKGRKWSEETKAHFRLVRVTPRGWHWTDEQKAAQSKRIKGKKWSEKQREKYNAWVASKPTHWNKRIVQLSMDGDFIREFPSIKEAESYFGGKRSNIYSVCKGKRPHCLGFKWKYV